MKIHLLIADGDRDYTEHLSQVLLERYGDLFEVSACSGAEQLAELLFCGAYDAALLSPALAEGAALTGVRVPLLLWDGAFTGWKEGTDGLRKYQRISSIVGDVLERCAEFTNFGMVPNCARARITAVWSPAGGVGKTTAALAYAAQKVSKGRRTVYLDLEPFSSTAAFFREDGKSISSVFEKLDTRAELVLQSIRQEDSGSGIYYFCKPDNYEDISILTAEDAVRLAGTAVMESEELVIDLGSVYDQKTAALLEMADSVLLVLDGSKPCKAKWEQFQTQHELYEKLRGKGILVINRGGRYGGPVPMPCVSLPQVRSEDPCVVYKTLSAGYFQD